MKKRCFILCGIFASLFLLTACRLQRLSRPSSTNQQTSSQQEKKLSVADLFKEAKKANRSVNTVHLDMITTVATNKRSKHQTMTADVAYSAGTSIDKINAVIEEDIDGVKSYQAIVGDQNTAQSRTSKDGKWTKIDKAGNYSAHPSYFNFLKVLYSMKDDLKLKQTTDGYKLSLRSQNVDIISLFREELNLYVRGVSQTELQKEFEVTFDKKHFHLQTFRLNLSYKGEKIAIKGKFSNWNKVRDAQFSVPDSGTA